MMTMIFDFARATLPGRRERARGGKGRGALKTPRASDTKGGAGIVLLSSKPPHPSRNDVLDTEEIIL